MRSGEVAALRLDQIDWSGRTLRLFRLKRRQPQIYPLVLSAAEALARYIDQELADDLRRQLFHGHSIHGAASLFAGKRQQQCQRVAVAGLGVAGKIALGDQMFQQEPPDPRTKQALILHGRLHRVQSKALAGRMEEIRRHLQTSQMAVTRSAIRTRASISTNIFRTSIHNRCKLVPADFLTQLKLTIAALPPGCFSRGFHAPLP